MRRSTLTTQRLVAVFLAAFLLLYSPVMSLFAGGNTWFDVPLLYFYIFGVWAGIIAATAWILSRSGEE